MPDVGDLVFFSNQGHVGVIVLVAGNDPSEIYVVHASYDEYQITVDTLETFQEGNEPVYYGSFEYE